MRKIAPECCPHSCSLGCAGRWPQSGRRERRRTVEDSLFRAAAELDTQTFDNRTSEVDEDQALWAPASQSTAATSALVGEQPLFYQMQVLQQEVRQLSGLVEEQSRLIQKLQQNQRLQ